jgi:sigma-B regulation protein RsbU (phosphoserine phosphatase)
MNELANLAITGFSLALTLALLFALTNHRRKAQRMRRKFREIEGEEERMFSFLHDLGLVIGREPSDSALSRMIVEGVLKVVGASGGAIYREAHEPGFLNPAYVSEACPALVTVPQEILEKAKTDPRALESHLRLARVAVGDGLIGIGISMPEAIRVQDEEKGLTVMISPLRYAGKDIGVLAVARQTGAGDFTDNDFAVFRSVSEQSSFTIGNARVHREANEKKEIEGELKNAREVQRVLLPQEDPVVTGFRVNGTNLPAKIISGDYYDYIDLPNGKLGVAIADVSGKGVPAGLLMAMCRSLLRAFSQANTSPSAALSTVNRYLFPDIREDMFISMIYGILDPADGSLTFARAGHEPALIFRKATGLVEISKPKGLALGIDSGNVFERVTADERITLSSGDCVLLFTDGVKEALDASEEEFGLDRLSDTFRDAAQLGAEAVVKQVQEVVKSFTGNGPQMDDVTIVAIEKR